MLMLIPLRYWHIRSTINISLVTMDDHVNVDPSALLADSEYHNYR